MEKEIGGENLGLLLSENEIADSLVDWDSNGWNAVENLSFSRGNLIYFTSINAKMLAVM